MDHATLVGALQSCSAELHVPAQIEVLGSNISDHVLFDIIQLYETQDGDGLKELTKAVVNYRVQITANPQETYFSAETNAYEHIDYICSKADAFIGTKIPNERQMGPIQNFWRNTLLHKVTKPH